MRARTEDLLKIRDREPVDAAMRDRIVADPDNAREIARLARVAEDLRGLPDVEPPPGVWARIAADAAPARRPRRRSIVRYTGAALAASVAAAALLILQPADPPPPTSGTGAALPMTATRIDYAPLVEESVRLERLLSQLDRGPSLMSAGTASTIADLEDHIVLLDEQLTYAEARGADPRYRQELWRERVDVMSALLHVRYSQSRHITYRRAMPTGQQRRSGARR